MLKLMHKGPEFILANPAEHGGLEHESIMRPLSAVDESLDNNDQKEKDND